MLSYDYSHFEACLSLENDQGLTTIEIDEARKTCQRLASKAVEQYKTYKAAAAKSANSHYEMEVFENTCKMIAMKNEHDRTLKEIAMLKEYQDETWRAKWKDDYDYDDDENYSI